VDVDVLAHAVELARRREPFALATVVWRRAPSSGQVGAKAVLHADGTMRGWLGGACAQPTVLREALASIADGQPRLLFLGRPEDFEGKATVPAPGEGIVTVPMACESEGAMEVYVEPVLPPPLVVVVGRSPAVHALARLATGIGWQVAVIDDGGDPQSHPRPEVVRTTLDLTGLGIDAGTAVVVATQGSYDDLALEAALASDAGYIGLVAAEKRASATLALLADRGVSEERLARVVAPAGLDLGRVQNAEIAVGVLAELVSWRASGRLHAASALSPTDLLGVEATDPVCGMTVLVREARHHLVHDGVDHWFCGAGCLAAFRADPTAYLGRPGE
jgi:xanthine dehydrogenase accessory factor